MSREEILEWAKYMMESKLDLHYDGEGDDSDSEADGELDDGGVTKLNWHTTVMFSLQCHFQIGFEIAWGWPSSFEVCPFQKNLSYLYGLVSVFTV